MPAASADFISIIERLAKQEVRMEAVRKDIVDVREGVHQGFDKLRRTLCHDRGAPRND